MKHVVPVRKELAVRTIFNFLGPLTNPAGATRQLLGVSDRRYQETIAEALVGLGCERALVVCADDGVDEISVAGRTRVIEVADGGTEEWFVTPEDLGLERVELSAIAGGTPGGERRRRPRGARGRPRPGARRRPAQRRRGDPRRRRRRRPRGRGRAGRARRSTPAPPRACSSDWSRRTGELAAR